MVYTRNTSGGLVLESAAFGGGRISKTSSSYEPLYQITDHLGSVRAMFVNRSTVRARNDYYAFGKRHANSSLPAGDEVKNRWLFNGKENQTTGNLKFLDYGARMYDSEIARMTTTDPLLEDRYGMTPYAYAANNPVNLIDWLGLEPQKPDEDNLRRLQEQQKAQIQSNIENTFSVDRAKTEIAVGATEILYGVGQATKDIAVEVVAGGIKNAGEKLEAGESLNVEDVAGLALDFAGIIPGVAVAKWATKGAKVVENGVDFFEGAKYTNKVLNQMDNARDLRHGFPSSVDNMVGQSGKVNPISGSDGKLYHKLEAPGSINGKSGTFEYIKNPSTNTINHRFFNTKGK